MALVIEDGSLVAGADSFVTVAEVRAFAEARASDSNLPAADADVEPLVRQAGDYIEALRDDFQGAKITKDQSLQFPRYNVFVDGFEYDADEIPPVLKSAQCQLAIDASGGVDLQPTGDGQPIKKEKVDVLETEYFTGSGAPQPVLTRARALLRPLLKNGGSLSTVRV